MNSRRRRQHLALSLALAATCFPAKAAPVDPAQCKGNAGYAAASGGQRTFLWSPAMLTKAKAEQAVEAKSALIRAANDALTRKPYSVVDKKRPPASGDVHDYVSIGPYWWPTPGKPSGEPYTRRDGRINPERNGPQFDLTRLQNFSNDVTSLSLAYHYTGDRRYAGKAAAMVRTWFLDPATRMNPNLTHAQAVPGRTAGRAEGIIDAFRLVPVVESIGLLEPSKALSPAEHDQLEEWFAQLVQWMATSPTGRQERAKTNNHGIYFDMLISHFALFARLDDVAKVIVSEFPAKRIEPQVAANGSLPEELTRTRTWHYTLWTVSAAQNVAQIGRCLDVDIWSARNKAGAGIQTALDFALPYVGKEKSWPYPDVAFDDPKAMSEEYRLAVEVFGKAYYQTGDARYAVAASTAAAYVPDAEERLVYAPLPR